MQPIKNLFASVKTGAFAALFGMLIASGAAADAPYRVEGQELKLESPIVFEVATDRLAPASDAPLEILRGYLEQRSYVTLRVEGHTDNGGSADANQTLSERRALAVAKWLVGHGVDCKRLIAVGFGGNKPIAPSDTPDNKAKNRRIAFVHAALRGHAIGGLPLDGGGHAAGDPCAK